MATALIITSGKSKNGINSVERFAHVQDFCDAVEAKLGDIRVCFTTYDDITVTVRNGEVTVRDLRNNLDIRDTAFVHFKNWVNDMQIAGMLARYLSRCGVAIYNSEVLGVPMRSKITQMAALAQNDIFVPNSFYAPKRHLSDLFKSEKLPEGISFPFIMKSDNGAKGMDNHLITSFSQALTVIGDSDAGMDFILQSYHQNDGDYRFLYVGTEEEPIVFLRKGDGTTHLNNTSQGGEGSFVKRDEIPEEYYEMTYRAAQVTGREIAGVDLLVDKSTNTPYILEVNQTPALATGYGVEAKIEKFVELIEQHVVSEEE